MFKNIRYYIVIFALLFAQTAIFAHNYHFGDDHDHHIESDIDCDFCIYNSNFKHDNNLDYFLSFFKNNIDPINQLDSFFNGAKAFSLFSVRAPPVNC
ncbi:MAG: hypothetical protein ISQ32_00420 [Rickettsiales bacterium]|nr:hypothetical protein [Rickettsiales bacterium]